MFRVVLLLFAAQVTFAQVTINPTIERKSASHVFINKIEITEKHTVFHMQFYYKQANNAPKELFRMLDEFGFSDRESFSRQTISFQKDSKIRLSNGETFKFVNAENIPIAPERKSVEAGKKYFFKVYFEKIPAGFEKIDLIENAKDRSESFQFWNFEGIKINNPKDRKVGMLSSFKVYGKLIDEESDLPIKGRVYCYDEVTGNLIDDLETSKTGKFEFEINNAKVRFEVDAEGYFPFKESLNLSLFLKDEGFEKDLFLSPQNAENQTAPVLAPDTIKQGDAIVLDKVYFELGKANVLEESYEQLNQLVVYLSEHLDYKVKIVGHTDNQGDPKLNIELSKERALNVSNYLVSKGIDKNRIYHTGLGGNKPVSPNNTEANRSKNRRVEFSIEK